MFFSFCWLYSLQFSYLCTWIFIDRFRLQIMVCLLDDLAIFYCNSRLVTWQFFHVLGFHFVIIFRAIFPLLKTTIVASVYIAIFHVSGLDFIFIFRDIFPLLMTTIVACVYLAIFHVLGLHFFFLFRAIFPLLRTAFRFYFRDEFSQWFYTYGLFFFSIKCLRLTV